MRPRCSCISSVTNAPACGASVTVVQPALQSILMVLLLLPTTFLSWGNFTPLPLSNDAHVTGDRGIFLQSSSSSTFLSMATNSIIWCANAEHVTSSTSNSDNEPTIKVDSAHKDNLARQKLAMLRQVRMETERAELARRGASTVAERATTSSNTANGAPVKTKYFVNTLNLNATFSSAASFDPASTSLHGDEAGERRTLAAAAVPTSLCFEKISSIPAVHMATHPGGGRAVIGTQDGLLSLVSLPAFGLKATMASIGTWLDLRARTLTNGEQGLLSFAFHPSFLRNGRFFVSYICDAMLHPDCKGPCACNAAVGCHLGGSGGASCRGNTIVAEYSAGPSPATASSLVPREVRRVLTFARPYYNHNGGHIFFAKDGFLYYTSGDGGSGGDPWNFAQQGNTFLGKILRLDVNGLAKGQAYKVPPSNPFVNRPGIRPEIYALGLRNPWRCDQDRLTSVILCADVGQNSIEEVDVIVAGGNYGWHNYEGTIPFVTGGNKFTPVARMIGKLSFPGFQYSHLCNVAGVECVNIGGACVIGGVVYRAPRNKCLWGKYLYNDLNGPLWVGTIYPSTGSSSLTKRVNYRCAATTPLACDPAPTPLGAIWAWAKDLSDDAYALTSSGIFRLVALSKCGVVC